MKKEPLPMFRNLYIVPATLGVVIVLLIGICSVLQVSLWQTKESSESSLFLRSDLLILALAFFSLVAFATYWLHSTRRVHAWKITTNGFPTIILSLLLIFASSTFALGLLGFWPCAPGIPVLAPITHTLLLFVGSFDGTIFATRSGGGCVGPVPLGIELARFTSVATTFCGASAVLIALSKERLVRLQANKATNIDVVVGLTQLSVPLIEALLEETKRIEPKEPEWASSGNRSRSRRVVVLYDDAQNPLVQRVASLGALTVIANATDTGQLRKLLTHRISRLSSRRYSSVRRLFAVTDSQFVNLRILDSAAEALSNVSAIAGQRQVPRLVIRMDDIREAREFRLAQATRNELFIDAFSTDDLSATQVLDDILSSQVDTLYIQGSSPLVTAILDTLAWRYWSKFDLQTVAIQPISGDSAFESPYLPHKVVLLGDNASGVLNEWRITAPPAANAIPDGTLQANSSVWNFNESLSVENTFSTKSALIVTDQDKVSRNRAAYIARVQPDLHVFAFYNESSGIEQLQGSSTVRSELITRFGPALYSIVRLASGEALRVAPEDSWIRLARHLHESYCASTTNNGSKSRRPWGDATTAPDRRLPEFIREDNLRLIRNVLSTWSNADGTRIWTRYQEHSARTPTKLELYEIAESEHRRWCQLRINNNWSGEAGNTPVRLARLLPFRNHRGNMVNPNIRDWETGIKISREGKLAYEEPTLDDLAALEQPDGIHEWNLKLVERALSLLAAYGIRPVTTTPLKYFQRRGFVTATTLKEAQSWTTTNGDRMQGRAGDWLVETENGPVRTVAAAEFNKLYEPIPGSPNTYRRIGNVTAQQVDRRTIIHTLEGLAIALPTDWVVTDATGNSWPVPHEGFLRTYSPTSDYLPYF